MSSPPDESVHARAQDEVASLALGEPADPALTQHIAACASCQAELEAYRRVVDLAREDEPVGTIDEPPPPRVWERIQAEVTAAEPPAGVVSLTGWRRVRTAWFAAAAAVLVAVAAATGWAIGRDEDAPTPSTIVQASLRAQPGTPVAVHGTATVNRSSDGARIDVSTRGLPQHNGYYEVWLYDPADEIMVPIGTLGGGGRGTFTVPGGLDLSKYHVVDVSAQDFGTVVHQRSVLRGSLPR